jgi:hypothetical protein
VCKHITSLLHFTYLHGRSTVVFFNEPAIPTLGHGDRLGKSLFLEIANGVIVGVGDKVFDACLSRSMLEQVHQLGAVSLDLLRANQAERVSDTPI